MYSVHRWSTSWSEHGRRSVQWIMWQGRPSALLLLDTDTPTAHPLLQQCMTGGSAACICVLAIAHLLPLLTLLQSGTLCRLTMRNNTHLQEMSSVSAVVYKRHNIEKVSPMWLILTIWVYLKTHLTKHSVTYQHKRIHKVSMWNLAHVGLEKVSP